MAETTPRCAVIIPTYNGAALTTFCLKALLAHPPSRCQWTIVVVDDASTEPVAEKLARFEPHIQLVEQEVNTGFAGACNAGARAAGDCDHVVFLNNDTLPVAGWLDALVEEVSADERVAVVGSKLLFPNGQVQHAGVAIGQDRWPHHLYGGFPATHPAVNRAKQVAAVTAACMLVRRADFDQLGGFDTGFQNGYEDVDLCLRLASRQRLTRYCPRSVVYHLESVTRWPSGTPERTEASVALYEQRWRSVIAPDDLQHYVDDGLLEFSYGPHYPVRISVSSELAVVDRDGEELVGLERVLSLRSRQVMELLSAQTRRQLKAAVGNSAVLSAPRCSSAGPARRIADGSQHQLGAAESGRLISVVIPVKNGARDLEELLPSLLGQSIQARLEIVAIDSGSADDTIEVLGRFGATVLAIEPTDFDHALTRNLGAEQAAGDVLVFLSQRTRPVGERWLAPLIAQLDGDPEVVGVCSRIIARDDADVLTRKDSEHELSGSGERQRKQISDWSSYRRMSAHDRRVLLNFHTVSAAIRAEALRRTPFPPVRTIGEDLLWAREVLESGWALVHEPDSVARHSHSYTLSQLFSRNVDDGIANRDIVERSFGREEIAPMIRAIVDDDWSYLRETLGLSGAELENWQRESALRRVTQVAGQWLGVNYERLPEGTAAQFSSVAQLRAGSDADRPATR